MIDVGTDREGHSVRMLVSAALRAYPTATLFQFLEDRDVIVRSLAARQLQLRAGRGDPSARTGRRWPSPG